MKRVFDNLEDSERYTVQCVVEATSNVEVQTVRVRRIEELLMKALQNETGFYHRHGCFVYKPNASRKSTLTWLMVCQFCDECVWSKLPKEIVEMIARHIWSFEQHEKVIYVFGYLSIRSYVERDWCEKLYLVHFTAQDYEKLRSFFEKPLPVDTNVRVEFIILTHNNFERQTY